MSRRQPHIPCMTTLPRLGRRVLCPLLMAMLAPATVVSVYPVAVDAQGAATSVQRVDSLFSRYTVGDSPGLAVAVVRDGQVLLAKGYGLANLEHRIPITDTTVFDVASVSKQFTGLVVAMLVEQGRITLTDDIRKYIPELQVMPQPITIEHLLHHTSGMRDWPGTLNVAGWRYDDVISFQQILTMAYQQKTLNFVPGAEYTYSNTGYNLLAELVARVTGTSFRAWTASQVFEPLGMRRSVFRDDHTLVVSGRALGYTRGPDQQWHLVTNNLTALGSSSLLSSVDDMARWLINFDEARVGGARAMALSRTRGTLNSGARIPYAFGVSHGTYRGLATLSHSGSWAGFVSYLVQFPQQRAGVVILANTPTVNTSRAAYALADIFLADALAANPVDAPAPAAAVSVAAAQLDRYVGVYRLGPAWYVRIRREGDGLVAHVAGERDAPMTARSSQEFWVANYGASMTFAAASDRPSAFLTYRSQRAERVDARGLTPPASLSAYAGIYESEELGIGYPIVVRDSTLLLKSRQHGDVVLRHRWGDDFAGTGAFRAVVFQRDGSGAITGLQVTVDERSRNIRFAKRSGGN